jgi:hypothetical protein
LLSPSLISHLQAHALIWISSNFAFPNPNQTKPRCTENNTPRQCKSHVLAHFITFTPHQVPCVLARKWRAIGKRPATFAHGFTLRRALGE